jgi:hypothetical protein
MVVSDFDIESISISKRKADPPLAVDADAELARAITSQRFESIGRQGGQVLDSFGVGQDPQSLLRLTPERLKRLDALTRSEISRSAVAEGSDHEPVMQHLTRAA